MALAQAVVAADPTGMLVQYGALGVLAACAIFAVRVLFNQITLSAERDRARADRLEEELRKANADLQDKTLPALTQAQQVITQAMEVLREDRRER